MDFKKAKLKIDYVLVRLHITTFEKTTELESGIILQNDLPENSGERVEYGVVLNHCTGLKSDIVGKEVCLPKHISTVVGDNLVLIDSKEILAWE